MKIIISVICSLTIYLSCAPVLGQGSTDANRYIVASPIEHYFVGDRSYLMCKLTITIPSGSSNMFLWIDDDNILDENDFGRTRRFFSEKSDDFSLQELLVDDLLRESSPIIGKTFITEINEGNSFELVLTVNDDDIQSFAISYKNWINRHLVLQTVSTVNKTVRINPSKLFELKNALLVLDISQFNK